MRKKAQDFKSQIVTILSQRYHHDLNLHGKIFRAITIIAEMDIQAGNPPFQVQY